MQVSEGYNRMGAHVAVLVSVDKLIALLHKKMSQLMLEAIHEKSRVMNLKVTRRYCILWPLILLSYYYYRYYFMMVSN